MPRPRIPPLPPDKWPDSMRDAIRALRIDKPRHAFPSRDPGRPKGLNALGLLANHPDLATAYHRFNGYVQYGTSLTARQRELIILRVGHVRRSQYEWLQHSILAADAGITADEVDRIAAGPEAPGWSPLEAALLRATDELLSTALITDDTWALLASELDTRQLMDMVFTVGAYDVLAMAFNSFGLEVDDDLKPTMDL
jgi:alkylhydroperoxidase family enzyme